MKLPILAGGLALLALGACTKDVTLPGGIVLTPAMQQCVATNAAMAVKSAPNLSDLSYKQKAAFIVTTSEAVADACGVDISAVRPYLDTAMLVAAD
jgi:hypothetical protein